jgi:hypothetical protein
MEEVRIIRDEIRDRVQSLVDKEGLNKAESSYLLDATRHNGLWFHQFHERNRLDLNGLLRQSIEQFAA